MKHLLLRYLKVALSSLIICLIATKGHTQFVITTIAGNGTAGFSGDGGAAVSASLNNPLDVTIDATGNIYIADAGNYRIRKVDTIGIIKTFAGNGVYGYSCSGDGDNGSADTAKLGDIVGVTTNTSGILYITQDGVYNNCIRETDIRGGNIYMNISTKNLQSRYGQSVVDDSGNIYLPDNFSSTIFKCTNSGFFSYFAANSATAGFSGDGGAAIHAKINNPTAVTIDSSGNIYIADAGNNRIRKISKSGIITTIVGNGLGGYSGDGGAAVLGEISNPIGLKVDAVGNLYIADKGNNRVRKVSTLGIISTVAGNGTAGYSGDGGLATSAELRNPTGIVLDTIGNMYVADAGNNCIRKISGLLNPKIKSFSPVIAPTGITVNIIGTAFLRTNTVSFGGIAAKSFTVVNDTLITATVNAGASGIVSISTPYGTTSLAGFYFCSASITRNVSFTGCKAVVYKSITYTVSTIVRDTVRTVLGCDSIYNVATISVVPIVPVVNNTYYYGCDSVVYKSIKYYSSTVLRDTVRNSQGCDSIYNVANITITQPVVPTVTVTASSWNIVPNIPVTFTCTSTLGGTTPIYQWKKNGVNVGSNSTTYIDSTLKNGDTVYVLITSNTYCAVNYAVASNKIVMIVTIGLPVINTVAGNGTAGYSFSGDGGLAVYAGMSPSCIAKDASGNIYIAEGSNNRVRKIDPNGIISTIAGTGVAGFNGRDSLRATLAQLNNPTGVAVDASGNLYIADAGNNVICKVKNGFISWVAGSLTAGYSGDSGIATVAKLNNPVRVAVDAVGNLYIADAMNNRVRKVNTNGIISTVAGNGTAGFSGDDGAATLANLNYPFGLVTDTSGNLYISDFYNNRIRKVNSNGIISTVAGNGISGYSGDGGSATSANISLPLGVLTDTNGNLYIADMGNNRVRKVSTNGNISTIAGNGTAGYSGDGGLATSAQLNEASSIAIDASGNLYIADYNNNRIRKVDNKGNISTVGGNGLATYYSSDGIAAINAELNNPTGVATDALGNIYIADATNNRIRKVSNSGVISTLAGGNTTYAEVSNPQGVAVDAYGNLYFADAGNNRIAKVSTSGGYTTTVVGNGVGTYRGDGGLATSASLYNPTGIAVDTSGNIYIADAYNNRIRKVNTAGIISTVAGNGTAGYSGDGGLATSAELYNPWGITIDNTGNLYIADRGTSRIRKVNTTGIISTIAGNGRLGYYGDGGLATAAQINLPTGVAIDNVTGDLYISTYYSYTNNNSNRIRKIDTNGFISTVAGNNIPGYNGDGGAAVYAELNNPAGVAVDAMGNLYIADAGNNRIREIKKVLTGADSAGHLELVSDTAIKYFGDTITVKVNIKGGVNIFSTYGYLVFDSAYLKLLDSKVGNYLGNRIINQPPVVSGDSINFGLTKTNGQSGSNGDGTVYQFRFVLTKLPNNVPYLGAKQLFFSLANLTVYNNAGYQPLSFGYQSILKDTTLCRYYVPVWPGDLNNDGIVNVADLLPIGYFYGTTGTKRPNASVSSFTAQPAYIWGYDISSTSGSGYETFADGNGDGKVDLADQASIGFNLSKTHARQMNPNLFNQTTFKKVNNTNGQVADFLPNTPAINISMPDTIIKNAQLPYTETVSINIGSASLPLNNLYGIAFDISFDPSFIDSNNISTDYTGSIFGTLGSNFTNIEDYSNIANGKLSIGITRYNTTAINATGGLALKVNLPFISGAPNGWFKITANPIGCNDKNGSKLTVTGSADSLIVGSLISYFTLGGNIVSPLGKSINNATVSLNGIGTLSNSSYNYIVVGNTSQIIKVTKNNDVNRTNGVTAVDIALVQSNILGKSKLNSSYKLIAADVNGDGKVTALDIVYMKRLILGIDSTFTNSTTKQTRLWAFVDSSYKFPDTTNPFPYKDSISYTGLSVSKTNQTFIGCKLGDVNWDWNPAIARPMVNNNDAVELSYSYPSDALAGRTDGYMKQTVISSDGYIHIPVKVKNFKDMLGMQFTISFDPSVMQWQGIGHNPLGIETGTNHSSEGNVTFLWVDPKNEIKTLEDGSVLIELVLKTIKPFNNETIDINSSITAIAAYDKDYGVHNVVLKRVENIQPIQTETWVVAPNPTNDGVIQVMMNLADNKAIVFRLIDNTGRVLLVKQVEGVKGSNNIALREGNIPGGTYYLQAVGVEGVKQLRIEN